MILAIFAVGKMRSRRRPSAIHFFFTSIEIARDYGFFIRDWSISIDIFGLRNNLFLGIYCLKIFLGEFFDDLFKPLASPKYLPRRHEDDGVGESAIQSSSSINIKHHHYHPHRHQKHHSHFFQVRWWRSWACCSWLNRPHVPRKGSIHASVLKLT